VSGVAGLHYQNAEPDQFMPVDVLG
jgi:hypothetical protein